jgi:hypothetical protein
MDLTPRLGLGALLAKVLGPHALPSCLLEHEPPHLELKTHRYALTPHGWEAEGTVHPAGPRFPLAPALALLARRRREPLTHRLPDSVLLHDIHLLDEQARLDAAGLVRLFTDTFGEGVLSAPVVQLLSRLSVSTEQLPERLREYLDIKVPDISFRVSSSEDAVELELAAPSQPLRFLLPLLGPNGLPELVGVTLRRLRLGTLSPRFSTASVDVEVDGFELVPLALALSQAEAGVPLPVPAARLRRTLHCRELLTVIPLDTPSLPIALGCEQLDLGLQDVSGMELHSTWGLHRPRPEPGELRELVLALEDFFLNPEAMLDLEHPPRATPPLLVIGPRALRLPEHLGAESLGTEQEVAVRPEWQVVASALNALKRFDLEALAELLPLEKRVVSPSRLRLGPLEFQVRWLLSTLRELPWLMHHNPSLRGSADAIQSVLGEAVLAAGPAPGGETWLRGGSVLLAQGGTLTAGGLPLEVTLGALASRWPGLPAGLRLEAALSPGFHLSLRGGTAFQRGTGVTTLQGALTVKLLEHPVLEGSFQGDGEKLSLEGRLNLLGSAPHGPLQVRGRMTGLLRSDLLQLRGEATLTYGPRFRLPSGTFELLPEGARYSCRWLGQELHLGLTPEAGNLTFRGELPQPLVVPGVLKLSARGTKTLGPTLTLAGPGQPCLALDGELSLLGMSFTGRMDLSRGRVRVELKEQHLLGVHPCDAVLEGVGLENLPGFSLTATLTGRFTALELALRDVLHQQVQAVREAVELARRDQERARGDFESGCAGRILADTEAACADLLAIGRWMDGAPFDMPLELRDVTLTTHVATAARKRFQCQARLTLHLHGERRASRERFEVDFMDLHGTALALLRELLPMRAEGSARALLRRWRLPVRE